MQFLSLKSIPRRTLLLVACLAAVLALTTAGCGKKDKVPEAMVMDQAEYESWEIALVEMRIEKNEAFTDPAQTPLRTESLEEFEGLNYYFPEASLRYRTPFLAEAGTDTVMLTKRKGQTVPYLKRGKVAFQREGKIHELTVFGPADTSGGDYLWLPFTDTTTGHETYGGGRYLDIEVDADGMVDLDFNYSYNPLCDYNPEKFNCTLPPAGNSLQFAVTAGEKTFSTAH